MKRAIISVSDKTGLVPFAKGLVAKGYEIISTGGTAQLLRNNGIKTLEAEDVTGFPECLDGRVKTLHPLIHGGILARRDLDSHMQTLEKLNISTIDLICVNLYPFANTVAKPDHTLEQAIENIDIGGPSLLRAGSKNYKFVTVVCDSADYDKILTNMDSDGNVDQKLRFELCAKAFLHTAAYDSYISQYLSKIAEIKFPQQLTLTYELKQQLRYGENSHQTAAFYKELAVDTSALTSAEFVQGKELSYNNIGDADGAIAIVKEFCDSDKSVCVAVKHANPCGVALGDDSLQAYKRAYQADPVSIFGGVLAFNSIVDEACAVEILKIFTEIVIAPDYTQDALKKFATKTNVRVLKLADIAKKPISQVIYKPVLNGLLVQDIDANTVEKRDVVTKAKPSDIQLSQLEFAMKICKHVKSNAIVLTKDFATVGIGGGSVSRIWAAEAAITRAGNNAKGAVMASDAFFPFNDVVLLCAKAGISAIIQPGGSINDGLSIKACDEANIPMVITGIRHFKH